MTAAPRIGRRVAAILAAAAVLMLSTATPAPADSPPSSARAPVTLAAPAAPRPDPDPSPPASDDPCAALSNGPARDYCKSPDDKTADKAPPSLTDGNPLDPMSSLADSAAKAASWIITRLSYAVSATSAVDFTNAAFLKQYAIVFAASTFLTLILWLFAVAKRAIRGVPLTRAFGEAIGFLWLTVLASAFTPLILYTVTGAADGVTAVIADKGSADAFFGSFSQALAKNEDMGGGPLMKVIASLISIFAAGILWLELVIRTAILYVGAALGTVVYSGLVDKQLWGRVRTWAGIMTAVIMAKPVTVIVLQLASALSNEPNSSFGAVISGLSIIILAILASGVLYRFVPGLGDEISASRRAIITQASPRNRMPQQSVASGVQQGITAHSIRGSNSSPAPSAASHASGGIAAHSSRPSDTAVPEAPRKPDNPK